ncbi:alpha-tocopherol transfer protein [Cololabis saira]|uniref:alpha-tocopherol transfer protein n=1 Tax=Cololabis saira TaxID=129043 RepID=UPI002AD24319|nr:alpha-tocopherol transfer protein [Cololabis saira]
MSGQRIPELPERLRPALESLRRRAELVCGVPGAGGVPGVPPGSGDPSGFSDRFLLKFLRARDFDVPLSLKLLLNYLRWRRESPEIGGCLDPCSVLGLLHTSYHAVLPQRDRDGSRVLLYRIGQWNPKDWSAFQVFRVSLMTSELISMETETQLQGVKVVFDLQGWSLGHALQINLSLARKISSVLEDSFPLKVRGIHLVNEPLFFRPVFAMIRPLLPDKIKQRVHMHGPHFQDALLGLFPPQVLPPEYGGAGPRIEEACQDWTNQLLRAEDYLKQVAAHPTGDVRLSPGESLVPEEAGNPGPADG